MWRLPETTIGSRNGFSGWDTHACSGTVRIGSRNPAMAATRELEPATAWSTRPHAMRPRVVSTPVTRPRAMRIPVTSVPWWISTPRRAAPLA